MLILGLIVPGMAACGRQPTGEAQENEAAQVENRRAGAEAQRAVAVLPPGVQNRWEAYVDARFDDLLKRQGRTIQIGAPPLTFVSVNAPYVVDCDGRGDIDVNFGEGDEAPGINLVSRLGGPYLDDAKPRTIPELGVDPDSIAAVQLYSVLCQRVSLRMEQLTAQ